jgi:hypothetical protein
MIELEEEDIYMKIIRMALYFFIKYTNQKEIWDTKASFMDGVNYEGSNHLGEQL